MHFSAALHKGNALRFTSQVLEMQETNSHHHDIHGVKCLQAFHSLHLIKAMHSIYFSGIGNARNRLPSSRRR